LFKHKKKYNELETKEFFFESLIENKPLNEALDKTATGLLTSGNI
jgi:hypothetical protein